MRVLDINSAYTEQSQKGHPQGKFTSAQYLIILSIVPQCHPIFSLCIYMYDVYTMYCMPITIMQADELYINAIKFPGDLPPTSLLHTRQKQFDQ